MSIICLGWGSLIWDPRDLKVGEWHTDGPALPVEFARVSRDGRLTLVLLQDAPRLPVLYARLAAKDVPSAISALARRENCGAQNIGVWRRDAAPSAGHAQAVAAWASGQEGIDAVVWTSLGPRYATIDGRVPTAAEAVAYLESLSGESKTRAEEYVRKAPSQIGTAYRKIFQKELGWEEAR